MRYTKLDSFLYGSSALFGISGFLGFIYCMISSVLTIVLVFIDTAFGIIPAEIIRFLLYSFGFSFLVMLLGTCLFFVIDDLCIKRESKCR